MRIIGLVSNDARSSASFVCLSLFSKLALWLVGFFERFFTGATLRELR